jgi:hypothetical protein
MSCKALKVMITHAWERCASMAEHTPDIDALAFEWSASPVYCPAQTSVQARTVHQGISIAMPMYVMDRLHAQDGWSGQVAPSLVRRQAPPRHQLAGHLSSQRQNAALLGSGPVRMRTVNGTHCVSGPREAPEDNSIAARSLITQMETVKVQSAELRHFGVEREWGDTHIMALKSRVRMQSGPPRPSCHSPLSGVWTPTSVAVPCLTTSCELTLRQPSGGIRLW